MSDANDQPATASTPTEVRYQVADRVATITIDRPQRRNALSWQVIRDLRAAVARARDDDAARVVVLTGAGDKAFSAGADLGQMVGGAPTETHVARGELGRLFQDLWAVGKPTIARVRGYALAGGFGLALACDLVVAADDAVFGAPEIDVGLWPMQITVPLLRSMPPKLVLELMMTGRRVGAEEAQRLGFVSRVVGVDELDAAVAELAAVLAAKPPTVMRLGRDAFYAVLDQPADAALAALHALLTVVTQTEEAAEGSAAFAEKRPPRWA